MKIFSSKKRVAAIGVVTAATLVGGGVAYAYWTASGTGTGSAAVGTSTDWVVGESGDVLAANATALQPDSAIGTGSIQVHEYTVLNPAAAGVQTLAKVDVSIKTSTGGTWSVQADSGKPACTAADFSVGGKNPGVTHSDATLAQAFAPGQDEIGTVTVQMINRAANQDNCKGISVPLYFSAS